MHYSQRSAVIQTPAGLSDCSLPFPSKPRWQSYEKDAASRLASHLDHVARKILRTLALFAGNKLLTWPGGVCAPLEKVRRGISPRNDGKMDREAAKIDTETSIERSGSGGRRTCRVRSGCQVDGPRMTQTVEGRRGEALEGSRFRFTHDRPDEYGINTRRARGSNLDG